jgi:[protein-PII] uridylyltransferase
MKKEVEKIENQRRIINRLALQEALTAVAAGARGEAEVRAAWLPVVKQTLADGRSEIRGRFEESQDGAACVRETCFLIDQLIRCLYDAIGRDLYPAPNPTDGELLAVVAVGGYGRGELAPQSDIDLLFLHHRKPDARIDQIVETVLYTLWDVGLKVGHSTRSVEECLRQAKSDWTICTALLEARFIWGHKPLFAELKTRFGKSVREGREADFLEAKLAERDERHERLGDSRYVLEPNIKDGKGGLRDLHTLYWTAKFLYGVDDISELTAEGALTVKEVERFAKAQVFLWTVRAHLHFLANRPEERMTFDVQPELARRMGYTDHAGSSGVERFMKHYFLVAKEVGDLTRIFLAAFEAARKRRGIVQMTAGFFRRDIEGFPYDGHRISIPDKRHFRDNPLDLLRIFKVANRRGLELHPEALAAVTRSLNRVGKAFREDPEANELFMDILCAPSDADKTLRQMNECGLFGKFVPDFGRVVAQMQYDMYHVYTTDEHTIRAIGILNRIDQGLLTDEHPVATRAMRQLAESRRVLYVAVLLHDIAKGRGGDHSVLGEKVAHKVCPRFGLTPEETETVGWLVLHHLAMSKTATKRDLDDPKTVQDFVDLVRSPERLRLLLCLTVVDIKAVGPNVWNNWKGTLLRELYWRAEEVMAGASASEGRIRRAEAAKARLAARLQRDEGWTEEEIDRHVARAGKGYFLALSEDTLVHHARIVRQADREPHGLALETRIDAAKAVTELTVYCGDHPGLIARLSGAIALAGGSVVDAKITTMKDGMALDTFLLQDAEGGAFSRSDRLARLSVMIHKALAGEIDPMRELAKRAQNAIPSRTRVFSVAPKVVVDNRASAAHTVIEVNGTDRPGLLYKLTAALAEQSLQIAIAKISTYGEQAVDVFYVKDSFGMKVTHPAKIEQLRAALRYALIEGEEATSPPPTRLAKKALAKKALTKKAARSKAQAAE